MKSTSMLTSARYGTLTLPVRLGTYEVLSFCPEPLEQMFVVLPAKHTKAKKLAKELRAIAKRLEKGEE